MYLHQALRQPDAREFVEAVIKEVDGHIDNNHWKLIPCTEVPEDGLCSLTILVYSVDKPIGASPCRDYVLTRMVLMYEDNLVLYCMVRNDTSKKGGNAPRATDEKRCISSASLILKGST